MQPMPIADISKKDSPDNPGRPRHTVPAHGAKTREFKRVTSILRSCEPFDLRTFWRKGSG